ncbi:MAG TPA: bifunctional UDP-N-acetylglucosamine diphosphorylase/glucosamine-1-phosphate N-acetyltransferase GlmU [Vicinamibacterales bacterium]|nr:bifunctional UDP-N-acetylglucosamine diphosphorylase/glucosamine-1-phosphate N-acetyltransferase GlmU [Vicinamibacterales bacterium]
MPDTHVVVLAAGKGTRMRSAHPKVLHRAAGLPLIEHVLRATEALHPATNVVVIGHQAEDVQQALAKRPGLRFAVQEPQLGTAHALQQAAPFLEGRPGTVMLLYGDVPLLRARTLQALLAAHRARGAAATVLTAHVEDPHGYGRIVRENGAIAAIVEERDATPAQRGIDEINSGIYAFELTPLFDALRRIGSGNAQGEHYLTDLVRVYRERGLPVETLVVDDAREILGVNSRKELAEVTAILNQGRTEELMAAGVTIVDPASAWIGPDVVVGTDTILHPGVYLEGSTRIGAGCEIHSGVRIVDSTLDDGVVVNNFCVITESHVGAGARVGPFAHVRPQSDVGEQAHVGNFVELKKTSLGRGSKANHLAYLGDATIGEKVNVGAGTITCNYDGEKKHPTVIEDGAFIGSDSQLIAPVRVGRGAYVAAGSSITDDVPAGALGIARGKQVNREGWVEKRRSRKARPAGDAS